MKGKVIILEFPSNLGLKEPSAGKQPGVVKLPDFLRAHKFHDLINPAGVKRLPRPEYSMELDKVSGVRNADKIADYAKNQAGILKDVISAEQFALVIGGDCSILIGNALALKQNGKYGLFFLDGHTDFMWPALSHTGGAAGMDLAMVTGYGPEKLCNIDGLSPYFLAEHVWCVGNRDYEEWYVKAIEESPIKYVDLTELRNVGIRKCVEEFLRMVKDHNLDGFWLHIDVDVLNNEIMPAVDSPQPDGLHYYEFNEIVQLLLKDDKATGLEITILDPDLDQTGHYTQKFVENFCKSFTNAHKK